MTGWPDPRENRGIAGADGRAFGPATAILYTLTALCLLLTFVYHWLVLRRFEAEA